MPGEIEDMKLETPRKIDRAFAKEFGFHWWEDSYEND